MTDPDIRKLDFTYVVGTAMLDSTKHFPAQLLIDIADCGNDSAHVARHLLVRQSRVVHSGAHRAKAHSRSHPAACDDHAHIARRRHRQDGQDGRQLLLPGVDGDTMREYRYANGCRPARTQQRSSQFGYLPPRELIGGGVAGKLVGVR
jgi:hypothetical protein